MELEAEFVRALRLLHSRAKDSADILKSMLDEVLKNKTNSNVKTEQKKPIKGIETPVIKSSNDFKKEIEKKPNFEKIRSESFEYPNIEKKRIRLDSPQTSRSTSSSPTPFQTKPIVTNDEKYIKIEEDSEATDIEDENTDAGEFAFDLGLACIICKQIDIAPNNQLVECQECHNLYHQECHKPALIDQDVSDPRFVWYCAKCQKTLKKIAVKPSKGINKSPNQTPTSTSTVSQFKEFATQGIKTPVKGETNSDSRQLVQPFKRVESKVPVSNPSFMSSVSSSSSAKPIGLAALANISRSSSVSSSTSTTTKNKISANNGSNGNNSISSTTAPTNSTSSSLTNADKRLSNIKKSKSGRQK